MPENSAISSISSLAQDNPENVAKLLKDVAKELYGKNLELYREQSRLNEILVQITEVIIAIDQDFKITLFNKSAEDIFNTPHKEAIGKHADEVIKIYKGPSVERLWAKDYAFKSKSQVFERVSVITDEETAPEQTELNRLYFNLESTYVDFSDNKKEAVIALSDITHEVEIDNQKDEFISIASHELKTPIAVVKNNLWMLRNTTKKKFSHRDEKFLNDIESGVTRLQYLVNNLLNVSRIQQGRVTFDIQKVNIYDLTIASLETLKNLADKRNIKIQYPGQIEAVVEIDASKYQEIFENFLSNAIKYAPNGIIKITIEPVNPESNKFYKISVEDNGPGIPKRDYDKIFTKFGRAAEGLKQQGGESSTGLGLYISKQFAKQMGGNIGFTSQLGKGTTFWFTVPINSPLLKGNLQFKQ